MQLLFVAQATRFVPVQERQLVEELIQVPQLWAHATQS